MSLNQLASRGSMPSSSSTTIRAVLLGNGESARYLMLPAAAMIPELKIEAICARDRARMRETAARWKIGLVFDDCYRALDMVKPDLAIVALPPALQLGVLERAVYWSTHVLLEKPAAVSVAAAERMGELARTTANQVTVNLPLRFHPAFICLAAVLRVEAAALPWPKLRFRYLVSTPRQPWYHDRVLSGGPALTIGIHPIDILLASLPLRPGRLRVRDVTASVAEFQLWRHDRLLAEGTAGWSDAAPGIEFALPDRGIRFLFGPGDQWSLSQRGRPTQRGSAFAGFAEQSSLHDMVRRIQRQPASARNDLRQHVDLLLPLIQATHELQENWREVDLAPGQGTDG